jgi:hypothetical protein
MYDGRITEEFIIQQVNYHVKGDQWQDIKTRTESMDKLYAGHLAELFPEESALPDIMLVENKFKNSLHDSTRLAKEGRGMPRAVPRGDKDKDRDDAKVREAILSTYWVVGRGRTIERSLYMDLAGTGMAAIAGYHNDDSEYPQFTRLNPRYCYPTVRNGSLFDLLHIETLKERVAAQMYPRLGLNDDPKNLNDVFLACYYGKDEVVEAVVLPEKNQQKAEARFTQRWKHRLGRVPVAFRKIDTYDDSIRGIFDQLQGPMIVRNKIMRFMTDYLESIAHSPLWSKGVENADEIPGPLTHYKLDPDMEGAGIGRVPPAAPAGTVWGMLNYTDQQESREAIEPSSRVGSVQQSIASGSFVYSTQGALTSFVTEMQDCMSDLREQLNIVCNRIDEEWMNFSKPLIKAVGKKKSYTPKQDIDGWYHHTIEFGATAGLDRVNGDTRVLNHLSARLIDRGTARDQIDYLDDDTTTQDKIDRENLGDAIMQRFATDPTTPMSVMVQTWLAMDGESFTKALEEAVPQLQAAEQAAQTQTGGPTAPEGGTPLEGGGEPAADAQVQSALLRAQPSPSRQQVFINQGR